MMGVMVPYFLDLIINLNIRKFVKCAIMKKVAHFYVKDMNENKQKKCDKNR